MQIIWQALIIVVRVRDEKIVFLFSLAFINEEIRNPKKVIKLKRLKIEFEFSRVLHEIPVTFFR